MQRNSTAKKLTATIVHAIYNTLLPDTCALCEQILTPAPQITYAPIVGWLCPTTSIHAPPVSYLCNNQTPATAARV